MCQIPIFGFCTPDLRVPRPGGAWLMSSTIQCYRLSCWCCAPGEVVSHILMVTHDEQLVSCIRQCSHPKTQTQVAAVSSCPSPIRLEPCPQLCCVTRPGQLGLTLSARWNRPRPYTRGSQPFWLDSPPDAHLSIPFPQHHRPVTLMRPAGAKLPSSTYSCVLHR